MRPVRLAFQGFTCFKTEQNVDFSTFDLFAITGPTGAGKTSILDAMIFALYGKVPRLGKHGISGMVSHGRDRAAVRLDFRVGTQLFRVVRSIQRAGPARAQLEEMSNGTERPLADRIKDVDDQIERIIGLPYEVFTQAVVLPQGDFARFLQSTPGERQKIIQDLLRLYVYSRMRELAATRAQKYEIEVKGLKQRLAEDFADATQANLESVERLLKEAEERATELDDHLSRARSKLEETRSRHQQSSELRTARATLHTFEQRMSEIELARNLIAAAQRAALLAPFAEAMTRAARVRETEQEAYLQAQREATAAGAAYKRAEEALKKAQRRADEIPELDERIQRLAALEGTFRALKAANKRLGDAEREAQDRQGELNKARREFKDATEKARELKSLAEAAKRRLQAVVYDAPLDRLLEQVMEKAAELAAFRERMAEASREAKRLNLEASRARGDAERQQTLLERTKRQAMGLKHDIGEVERKLEAAKQEHAAAHLRAGLTRGQACPVCGQQVAKIPKRLKPPVFAELESRLRELKDQLEKKRDTERGLAEEIGRLKGEAKRAERQSAQYQKDSETTGLHVEERQHELESLVGPQVKHYRKPAIEQRIMVAAREMASAREAFRIREAELNKATVEKERIDNRRENVSAKMADYGKLVNDAQRKFRGIKDEIDGLEQEIRAVTTAPQPELERAELERVVEDIEQSLRSHQQQEADAKTALAQAAEKQTQIAAAVQKAITGERQVSEQAEGAARQAGFKNSQEGANALRSQAEIQRLQEQVEAYDRDLAAVSSRVKRLEEVLANVLVDDDELLTAQQSVDLLDSQVRNAATNVGAIRQRRSQIVSLIDKARELTTTLDEVQRSYATYARLQEDLRADHFQGFVLEESIRDLVAGASERLMQLTKRYTMELGDDRDYLVIDHDNAMERRSVYTLSGGETFMASLALALELSEQVQRSANAVVLESLFIDEGFGTLDPDVLEEVANTIELLQAGGRMVGIITHIPELAARMPSRLEVERQADGSRILSVVN